MVRRKSRWLLVKLDFESDILSSCSDGIAGGSLAMTSSSSTRKKRKLDDDETMTTSSIHQVTGTDIYRGLRDSVTQNFGMVGAALSDIQVRLYDPKLHLAIIKTTREGYPAVRSSLTVMTQIKQGGDVLKVVASTISVSGSARTARNAAWIEVRKRFGKEIVDNLGTKQRGAKRNRIALEKKLHELDERWDKIDSSC
jgi:RNase P/RNase MRP subunit POP5